VKNGPLGRDRNKDSAGAHSPCCWRTVIAVWEKEQVAKPAKFDNFLGITKNWPHHFVLLAVGLKQFN